MTAYYILVGLLILLDQLTKYLTVANIPLGGTVPFIEGIVSFTYLRNTGAAFSILEGKMWLFYLVTLIAVIVLVYLLQSEGKKHPLAAVSLSFMLAGALGNFIDRMMHQYVVDMIQVEFMHFAIFNVADALLTVGVVLFIVYILFYEKNGSKGVDVDDK